MIVDKLQVEYLLNKVKDIKRFELEDNVLCGFIDKIIGHLKATILLQDASCYSSLIVESRVIIELYSCFFQLYMLDNNEERKFRWLLWKYNGLTGRQGLNRKLQEQDQNQILIEKQEIGWLKNDIKSHTFYKNIPMCHEKELFKNYNSWRFNKSMIISKSSNKNGRIPILGFQELIRETNIKEDKQIDLYNLQSWHAHSNYLSVLQANQANSVFSTEMISFCNKLIWIVIVNFILDLYELIGLNSTNFYSHYARVVSIDKIRKIKGL